MQKNLPLQVSLHNTFWPELGQLNPVDSQNDIFAFQTALLSRRVLQNRADNYRP